MYSLTSSITISNGEGDLASCASSWTTHLRVFLRPRLRRRGAANITKGGGEGLAILKNVMGYEELLWWLLLWMVYPTDDELDMFSS